MDVYPPSPDFPQGFALNLTDGILRGRYRDGRSLRPMRPGQVYPMRVRAFPTANRFAKGHRIRLEISSSNFPRFDVYPNTGEPLGDNRRMRALDNSLHFGGHWPSRLLLALNPSPR